MNIDTTEAMRQFGEAMRGAGIEPPSDIIGDGQLHRFQTDQDKTGETSGFYKLHLDKKPAGHFGDFRTLPNGQNWSYTPTTSASNNTKFDLKIWSEAPPATAGQGYLKVKSIQPHCSKVDDRGRLLVPMFDQKNELVGIQKIAPNGAKKNTGGSRVKNVFCMMGTMDGRLPDVAETIAIAEGFATAATIFEATSYHTACAFGAGNLLEVGRILRDRYPTAKLIFCGDTGGAGTKATSAARAGGGYVVYPHHDGLVDGNADFNDLATLVQSLGFDGHKEVKKQIEAALTGEPEQPNQKELISQAAELLGLDTKDLKKMLARVGNDEAETILFPEIEPYHSPINPAELLDEMSETIGKFIVLDHHQADIVAAWCVATWFLDQVQIAPILLITAPEKGCGKTQLLSVAGKLVYRPLQSSGISPAAVYRVVEQYHPTLLIDEIDTVFNDKDSEPLRGVINAGHDRETGFVVRCEGDKHQPKQFNCFGFKALAGIKADQLKDTITDRSLVIRLERKTKSDHVTRLRHAPEGLFSTVQTKLARVKQDYTLPIKINLPDALGNRQQDNAEPLLQIAQIAGGEWVERLTNALLTLAGNTEPPKSAGVELLESIQVIFKQISGDRISTADLIKRLCTDPEGRWVGYNPKSTGDGRNINAKQIANLLKPFEVRSINMRDGYGVAKGYLVADFENAFQRYIATTPQNLPLHRYKPLQANIGAGFGVAGEETDNATEKSAATLEANSGAGYRRVADVAAENGGIEDVGIKIVNGKGMF